MSVRGPDQRVEVAYTINFELNSEFPDPKIEWGGVGELQRFWESTLPFLPSQLPIWSKSKRVLKVDTRSPGWLRTISRTWNKAFNPNIFLSAISATFNFFDYANENSGKGIDKKLVQNIHKLVPYFREGVKNIRVFVETYFDPQEVDYNIGENNSMSVRYVGKGNRMSVSAELNRIMQDTLTFLEYQPLSVNTIEPWDQEALLNFLTHLPYSKEWTEQPYYDQDERVLKQRIPDRREYPPDEDVTCLEMARSVCQVIHHLHALRNRDAKYGEHLSVLRESFSQGFQSIIEIGKKYPLDSLMNKQWGEIILLWKKLRDAIQVTPGEKVVVKADNEKKKAEEEAKLIRYEEKLKKIYRLSNHKKITLPTQVEAKIVEKTTPPQQDEDLSPRTIMRNATQGRRKSITQEDAQDVSLQLKEMLIEDEKAKADQGNSENSIWTKKEGDPLPRSSSIRIKRSTSNKILSLQGTSPDGAETLPDRVWTPEEWLEREKKIDDRRDSLRRRSSEPELAETLRKIMNEKSIALGESPVKTIQEEWPTVKIHTGDDFDSKDIELVLVNKSRSDSSEDWSQ